MALVVSMLLVAVVLPQQAATAQAETDLFPLVEQMNILDDDGEPLSGYDPYIDHERGRLLAYDPDSSRTYFVDLETLEQTGSVATPEPPGVSAPRTIPRPVSFDSGRELFFWKSAGGGTQCPPTVGPGVACPNGEPVTITAQSLAGAADKTVTLPSKFNGSTVKDIRTSPGSDLLIVVTQAKLGIGRGYSEVWTHAIDLSLLVGTDDEDPHLWSYQVQGCGQVSHGAVGIGTAGDFLYLMCQDFYGNAGAAQPYRPTNHAAMVVDFGGADPTTPNVTDRFEREFYPFAGDFDGGFSFVDPAGDRIGAVVKGGGNSRLFVFDARHRAWTGSVLVSFGGSPQKGVVDPATGRMYTFVANKVTIGDAAALPVGQGPESYRTGLNITKAIPAVFDPGTRRMFLGGSGPFPVRTEDGGTESDDTHNLRVYEDLGTPYAQALPADPDAATNDIDEELAAQVTHTGGGSAFGARALLVGGAEATAVGSLNDDQLEDVWASGSDASISDFRPEGGDRGLFLGRVIESQLTGSRDSGEAGAKAVGASLDEATETDLAAKSEAPFSRVGQESPEQLQYETLKANVGEFSQSECFDFGGEDDPRDESERGSSTSCRERDHVYATATSSEEMAALGVHVGSASSDVELRLDENDGTVSRSTAVARGVHIDVPGAGSISIGEVRAVAQTWAKGRPGTAGSCGILEPCGDEDSDLQTTISYVRVLGPDGEGFSCTTDCDPRAVTDAINERFPLRVQASGPRPDTDPAVTGSPGGAKAVIQKDPYAFWNDATVNGDSQHEVAALQLILYNDAQSASRLVVQLGAVSAESKYDIGVPAPEIDVDPASLAVELLDQAGDPLAGGMFEVRTAPDATETDLLDGDGEDADDESSDADGENEEGSDDGGADEEGSDEDGSDDDGSDEENSDEDSSDEDGSDDGDVGGFSSANSDDGEDDAEDADGTDGDGTDDGEDTSGDGDETDDGDGDDADDADDAVDDTVDDTVDDALGPDELVGACVTGDDGIGDCTFEDLKPGQYLVTQTAAPSGFTEAAPFPVTLTPGFSSTVTFTNVASTSTIAISLSDTDGNPLAGGDFSVLADDGDGLLGAADVEIGHCTTNDAGTCQPLEVPVGAYIVHQSAAPAGFEPAEDVAFSFTEPGQSADVAFVNSRPAAPPPPTASPAGGTSSPAPPPAVRMTPAPPPSPPTVTSEPIDFSESSGSPLQAVVSAPGDTVGFLTRNPGEAALFAGVWSILLAPAYLASRRRKLNLVKEGL